MWPNDESETLSLPILTLGMINDHATRRQVWVHLDKFSLGQVVRSLGQGLDGGSRGVVLFQGLERLHGGLEASIGRTSCMYVMETQTVCGAVP